MRYVATILLGVLVGSHTPAQADPGGQRKWLAELHRLEGQSVKFLPKIKETVAAGSLADPTGLATALDKEYATLQATLTDIKARKMTAAEAAERNVAREKGKDPGPTRAALEIRATTAEMRWRREAAEAIRDGCKVLEQKKAEDDVRQQRQKENEEYDRQKKAQAQAVADALRLGESIETFQAIPVYARKRHHVSAAGTVDTWVYSSSDLKGLILTFVDGRLSSWSYPQ